MRSSRNQDLVNVSLDGRQVVGVVIGTLVLLSVTFALGTTFGRRLATGHVASAAPADLGALDRMTPPPPTFAYGELLAKSDPTPVVEVAPKPKPAPRPAPVTPPEPPPAPAPEPVVQAAPEPQPQSPTVLEPPPAQPPATPKAEPADALAQALAKLESTSAPPPAERPTARYTVQFGASQDQAEADRLAARLLEQGLTPFVVTADIPGKGRFFRVRVGRFDDRQEADEVLARARSLGLSGLVMSER